MTSPGSSALLSTPDTGCTVPRQCAACISDDRAAFESAVEAGATVKAAAARFHLAYDTAARHIRLHDRARPSAEAPGSVAETFARAFGHPPMAWQRGFLAETRNTVLVKGRQVGATEAASALAIHVAMTKPGSTSAVVSPSLRQSSEVTVRARLGLWSLGETLRQDSASLLRLANGSRIISLPGSARGIRGYSCDLVVLDEAAWISAETFVAARPLVAATRGRLIVQSTPGNPLGEFYELVDDPPEDWHYLRVRSDEVPTITPAFLERERREMTPELYAQEYEAEFAPSGGGLFTTAMVETMFERKSA